MSKKNNFLHPIPISTYAMFIFIALWTLQSYFMGAGNLFLLGFLILAVVYVLQATKIAASEELSYTSSNWVGTLTLMILGFFIVYGTSPKPVLPLRLIIVSVIFFFFIIAYIINNSQAESEIKKGNQATEQGNLVDAQKHYEKALYLNPDNDRGIWQIAKNFIKQKKYDLALKKFEDYFQIKPSARTTIRQNSDGERVALRWINLYVFKILSDALPDLEPEFELMEDGKYQAKFEVEFQGQTFSLKNYSETFIDYLEISTPISGDPKTIEKKLKSEEKFSFDYYIEDDNLKTKIELQKVPIRGKQTIGIDESLELDKCLKEMGSIVTD